MAKAKAGVIVGDDELDAVEASPTQAEEESPSRMSGSRGWPFRPPSPRPARPRVGKSSA